MKTNRKHEETVTKEVPDLNDDRISSLKQLFPEAFSEGKVDFDKLRATLGDVVDDRPERYSFTWAGKRDAIRLLQTPSRATLVPCPEESLDWDTTHNVFIKGENLEVLKLLYKSYFGRVKMIYIDPPYNTGNDFIYPDDYKDPLDTYLRLTEQQDEAGNLLTSNPETSGRYHSAWLSMMYPRLSVARQLLREDGIIFVSIDDHEVHNLRLLMNEIFGEENFVANVVWQKRTSPDSRATLGPAHDSILTYARSLEHLKQVFGRLPLTDQRTAAYTNPDNDPRGRWASVDLTGQTGHATPSQFYEVITAGGAKYSPPPGRCWAISQRRFEDLRNDGRIWFGSDGNARPRLKKFLSEAEGMASWTWWPHEEVGHNQEATKELNDLLGVSDVFETAKPTRLVKRMVQLSTDPDDEIVLDFFAGSCTTAQAAVEINREDGGHRRFIMVQLPEPTGRDDFSTIADMGMERIRRAVARMKGEDEGQLSLPNKTDEDLGFRVFKLAGSNYRRWEGVAQDTPTAYTEQMELFADPLVEGWEPLPVILEVALKEGFGLNSRIERVESVEPNAVYEVTDPDKDQSFYICLDDQVRLDSLRPPPLNEETLFVCRDAALDDETAANLALQCRLKTI